MRAARLSSRLWLCLLVTVLILLPLLVTSRFAIDIFIRVLLFAFIGVAWNLMGGYAKQLSLGHAAYFGLGAYTSTILQINFGISPWIGMVAGGGVAMLASLPIGALCFRLTRTLFCHRHHCDRPSANAAVPEIPRFRMGRRGNDDPESRQRLR